MGVEDYTRRNRTLAARRKGETVHPDDLMEEITKYLLSRRPGKYKISLIKSEGSKLHFTYVHDPVPHTKQLHHAHVSLTLEGGIISGKGFDPRRYF